MQRHIYGYEGKNIEIFADNSSLAVNPFYIGSWLEFLSQTPRVAPFLSKNDPFVMALKKVLPSLVMDFKKENIENKAVFKITNHPRGVSLPNNK